MSFWRAMARGFTLIEMAIVLVVIGIVLSGGLLAISPVINTSKANETNARLDQIEQALLLYAMRYSCLPCPADGSLGTVAGLAEGDAPLTYTQDCADDGGAGGDCNVVAEGVVPWGTLGLSQQEATDGWGNLISYVVSTTLIDGNTLERTGGSPPTYPAGNLQVNDANPAGTTAITTIAAYVLISHGRDGAGALTPAGSTIQQSEAANVVQTDNSLKVCNNANPCRQDNGKEIKDATYFDDIVRWRAAPIIVQLCGASACGNPA